MQKHCYILLLIFLIASCDGGKYFPEVQFDAQFPKRNIDLSIALGDEITLKSRGDTLRLRVTSGKGYNLVVNEQGNDTLFYGTVSRFRGLYYFSRRSGKSDYRIFAVRVGDSAIYGLTREWEENRLIAQRLQLGEFNHMIAWRSPDSSAVRLHGDKREIHRLFRSVIDSIQPDTILFSSNRLAGATAGDSSLTDTAGTSEEYELVSRIYPNPTSGNLTIELLVKAPADYFFTGLSTGETASTMNGRLLKGRFYNQINTIDLSDLKEGTYIITVVDPVTRHHETMRIVKIPK